MKKTVEKRQSLDLDRMPGHIAIIMDGNGRWAEKRLMPRALGHRAGMSTLRQVVETCVDLKIKILTVFAFSTENWKRPSEEVNYLMALLIEFMKKEIDELNRAGVKIEIIGNYQDLSQECVACIENACMLTRNNDGLIFNIAINYGARRELAQAASKVADLVANKKLKASDIDETTLNRFMYTKNLADPDLLIRTAGEMRLSNFLLWQIAYTELWFTDVLWPDFTREDLMQAIYDYQQRNRRFGGLN